MALPKTLDRIEDVPEIAREHYAMKDGVYTLQMITSEEHAGLIKGLQDERGLRRDAEKQLTELKVKFEGIDPDEVLKLRERVKGLDDADIYDRNGIEALVAKRTESMKDDFQRRDQAKDREITQLKETAATSDRKWRQDRIKTALLDAATKVGVYKDAMQDAVQRGMEVFVDLDDQGNVVAKNGEDIRYGKDGVNPLMPEEWFLSIKPSAMHLWPPSSGGGAPAHHNGAAGGIDYTAITSPTERLTAFRQAQRGGTRG